MPNTPLLDRVMAGGAGGDSVPVAHPVLSHPHVDVPVALVALGTALLVVVVSATVPARRTPAAAEPTTAAEGSPPLPVTASWSGGLTWPQWTVRTVAVLLLLVAIVAGRAGAASELDNLAPALAIGAGWPLLVIAAALLGTVWRWVDPWDTLARVLAPAGPGQPVAHVWPAVVAALGWSWYLHAYPRPLDPRSLGLALAGYTVLTLAGCVALGRARWLASAEPVGLLLGWIGLVPRRGLSSWRPPRGAEVLLGVVVGGSLFGALRRTELWAPLAAREHPLVWSTLGLLVAALGLGTLVWLLGRPGGDATRAVVARAVVPVAAAVVVVVALARNRFSTSVQLLPGLVGDPLGRGWDLFGEAAAGIDPAPLGSAGLVALQLGLLAAVHVAVAATVPRSQVGDERLPVIVLIGLLAGLSLTAVALH